MTDNADRLYERLLVLRCQAGDEIAFGELVERYQPRLRFYLRKLLVGLGEPEDVLQEVWLDVYRALWRLLDPGAFRAWLYCVARSRALKQFRKQRLRFQPLDEQELADVDPNSDQLSADEARLVHAALDKLAPAHREVLVLRYVEDMSYEEIAPIVDCQIGTVRSRLHYAKRALRKELERDRHDERQRTR
jgi:RNA polymerase sigma-70 factor (ECF subfamily)